MHVPRPVLLRLARGSAILWLGMRLLGLLLSGLVGHIAPLPFGVLFFPLLVFTTIWVDARAAGERLLLGNLGVSPASQAAISLGTSASLELFLALVLVLAEGVAT